MRNRALFIIKPDGKKFLSKIFEILEKHDIHVITIKSQKLDEEQGKKLYHMHANDYFYPTLVNYISSGTCILLAVNSSDTDLKAAKREIRSLCKNKSENEILKDFLNYLSHIEDEERNKIFNNYESYVNQIYEEYLNTFDGIHASDPEEGEIELALFFSPEELKPVVLTNEKSIEMMVEKLAAKSQLPSLREPLYQEKLPRHGSFFN